MAAHQASPSLGFSRQEHWSGLPFPSPMHESEKKVKSLSCVQLSATPWTSAHQALPSMGFFQARVLQWGAIATHWSGVPLLPTPLFLGFPCSSAGKESTCKVGDLGSIPGLGRSPGDWKGYPIQYSSLENSMDCIVYGVPKSRTQLSDFHFHFSH